MLKHCQLSGLNRYKSLKLFVCHHAEPSLEAAVDVLPRHLICLTVSLSHTVNRPASLFAMRIGLYGHGCRVIWRNLIEGKCAVSWKYLKKISGVFTLAEPKLR